MRHTISLSPKEARRFALHCQGLGSTHPFGKGKDAVVRLLDHLGYLQIDTISVVQRAHHHILWSRIPGYKIGTLQTLQEKERRIFEFWAHAAAYLPISDYRFAIPTMEYYQAGSDPWPKAKAGLKEMVLERIRAEGPLMSKDFDRAQHPKGDGWWEWKPAKMALQRLFFEGKLMVRSRQGFQRIYDIAERVLPPEVNTRRPSTHEYAEFLIRRTLKAHGLATPQQMSYLRRGMGAPVIRRLDEMIEDQSVTPVQIGLRNPLMYYALTDQVSTSGVRVQNKMRILSPFDNCVIQRRRLNELWNYDYQIECYVPAPKRVYGYFCLPLLSGDRFVGRMDAKADRKTKILHIKHLVKEYPLDDATFVAQFEAALLPFMVFNGCNTSVVHRCTPHSLKGFIRHPRSTSL